MQHPNQEELQKKEHQILKDKQQVKKKKECPTQGPRIKNEKLEQENWQEGMQRNKKNKVYCSFYKFCVSFSSLILSSSVVRAW